jgi:hypothetical protein
VQSRGEICELPFADYRRAARQLRTVYAHRPVDLYRQLSRLAQQQDANRPTQPNADAAPRTRIVQSHVVTAGPFIEAQSYCGAFSNSKDAERFANLAALQFDGPVLRYSRRLALLRLADRMSIPRFHASLLIALIQHQRTGTSAASDDQIPSSQSRWPLKSIMFVLLVQAAIVLLAWQAL